LAQSRYAEHRAIPFFALIQCSFERLFDWRGEMKIGLAEFKMNDGVALAFQFLGAREYRERTLAAHHRHASSQRTHSDLPCRSWGRRKRDAQAVDKTWKEFERRRSGYQFDDLLISEHVFQLSVKLIIKLTPRAMQPVSAPQTQFLRIRKRPRFEIRLNSGDLHITCALLFSRCRVPSRRIFRPAQDRHTRGDQLFIPAGQSTVAEKRLKQRGEAKGENWRVSHGFEHVGNNAAL